jgi:hypothetical protein
MNMIQNRTVPVIAVAGVIFGLILGLVYAWAINPVQYTEAGPQHLSEGDQRNYLRALADLHAFDHNQERVRTNLRNWPEANQTICQMAATSPDPAEAARLNALAGILPGGGCAGVAVGGGAVEPVVPPAEPGGGRFVWPCLLGLLLIGVLGAIFMVWNRQLTASRTIGHSYHSDMPDAPPIMSGGEEMRATPIARFQSTYNRGYDSYDDSFSIENANGDFLGECGVGISESIGAESPKNATAFEVWLFDKNDIRTVTKVIMSDHAFFDEAIKAKLAPKGEPILARLNETVVLETASLIINAVITELDYGSGPLPPQSYFERFTVELSAWAKEGDYGEPDVQGRIDEMLHF